MAPSTEVVKIALVTSPSLATARELAKSVVENQLAACVNIVEGVTSVYFWENELREEPEVMLFIKTTEACYDRLAFQIARNHPYDNPEIIALTPTDISEPYRKWVADCCD